MCVDGRSRYMYIVLGLGAPSVQSCCTYRCLLPAVYLFMADIANPDLFVCSCRTWICFDITLFCEGLHGRIANNGKSGTHCWGREVFDTICTPVCNHRYSSTTCRLCRLELRLPLQNNFLNVALSTPCIEKEIKFCQFNQSSCKKTTSSFVSK